MKNTVLMNIIRWSARIIGTLMVVFTLVLVIGEILEEKKMPGNELGIYNIVVFVIWGAGLAGLLLALWNEGLGGMISLLCFIIFNILAAANPSPGSGYTPILLLYMLPSVLYLVYWWSGRKSSAGISES